MLNKITFIVLINILIVYKLINNNYNINNIYDIYPSDEEIRNNIFNIKMYSIININGKDCLIRNIMQLFNNTIKEYSKRDDIIKNYINIKISFNIKLKLIIWIKLVRYKLKRYKMLMNSNRPNFDFKRIKINDMGRYSITRPYEANQISYYIKSQCKYLLNKHPKDIIITDGTAGVGGDTINFSRNFKYVNSVEINKENIDLINYNCKLFNIKNVNIIYNDYTKICNILNQDVLYLDPPWGGVGYKNKKSIKLKLGNLEIYEVINLLNDNNILIFIKMPLNADLTNFNIYRKYTIFNKKKLPSFYLIQLIN